MNKEYVKSPLNYTGGKYKLLPQLLPLFPKNINTFVDVFAGGCNVGVNVEANHKVFNDINSRVIEMIKDMCSHISEMYDARIKCLVEQYDLNRENKDAYNCLRKNYNTTSVKDPRMLFTLIAHSFSNQIRFNKKGEFNLPFGKRTYNSKMQENLVRFIDSVRSSDVFTSEDFRTVLNKEFNRNDFVYCDPPYLITTATYNESGGWTEKDEIDLLEHLDYLNDRGIKFGLSNVIHHKGKTNHDLIEWSKDYIVHYIDKDYKNCNYQGKDTDKKTVEVYICNY